MSITPLHSIRPILALPHRPAIRPPTLSWLRLRAPQTYWFAPHFEVNLDARQRITQRTGPLLPARTLLQKHSETFLLQPLARQLQPLGDEVFARELSRHSHSHVHQAGTRTLRELVRANIRPDGNSGSTSSTPSLPGARPLEMVNRQQPSAANEPRRPPATAANQQPETNHSDWSTSERPQMATSPAQAVDLSSPLIGRLTDEVVRHIDRRMRSHRERMGRV